MWPDVPIAIGAIRNPVIVGLAKWLERTTYRRAAAVVALAPGMADDIVAKGVPRAKVFVIPNGCDRDVFGAEAGPSGDSSSSTDDRFINKRLVLFAGTLGVLNGVEYLASLASEVAKLAPDVVFLVIGDGRDREKLEVKAAELGVLGHSVHMLGPLPKREVARWMRKSDMVIALFTGPRVVWKDAVQNKFFDALAAGKPVACNFHGWQSELAMEASVGTMLDPTDLSLAARQLVAALNDEHWLRGVPERAKQLAEGRFDRDRLAEELETVLLRVAAA
jgi:glycosyltransferase involved in cell wall biosynthesis